MPRSLCRSSMNLATSAAPSMPWVLSVKQSTSVSGSCTVQMSATSLSPVRLSIST